MSLVHIKLTFKNHHIIKCLKKLNISFHGRYKKI